MLLEPFNAEELGADSPINPYRITLINTLYDACKGQRALWILCFACGHAARVSPTWLVGKFGDRTLTELRYYIRCRRCRERWGVIIPEDHPSSDWPRR
jgi:hypothetical protein